MVKRQCTLGLMLLSLSSCAGPLSLVSYTLAGGVAMHAKQDEFNRTEQEEYVDKCLPIQRKENPVASGNRLEAAGEYGKAYNHYQIGERLGYPDASLAALRLKQRMSQEAIMKAETNLKRYSDRHINSCFIRTR